MSPLHGIIKTRFMIPDETGDLSINSRIIYYSMAFENGIEDYKSFVGLTPEYVGRHNKSTVALEAHTTYLRKVSVDSMDVATRIYNFDGKKVHIFQELFSESTLIATQETLSISFDILTRRTCKFDDKIARKYEDLKIAQKHSVRPKLIGLSLKRLTDDISIPGF